jgi:hypothetical protein
MKKIFAVLLLTIILLSENVQASHFSNNKIQSQLTVSKIDTLKKEDMDLSIVNLSDKDNNNQPVVKIYIDFNWNTDPFWTLTDSILFTYDKNWRIKSSYLEVVHLSKNGEEKTRVYHAKEIGLNQIIWDYDILKAADVYGRAVITLIPLDLKTLAKEGLSSAEVQYFHEEINFTLKSVNLVSTRTTSWKY